MAPREEIDRIRALVQAGKASQAFVAASALAGQHTDSAEATRLAMDLALRVHGHNGPAVIAEALAKDHAGSLAADFAACYAHLCAGRLDAARQAAETMLSDPSAAADIGLLLAQIRLKQNGEADVLACLADLVARHPDEPRYHETLASLYMLDGNAEKAAEYGTAARSLGMISIANDRALGLALFRLGRHGDALGVLESLNRNEPGIFSTLAMLSVARVSTGNAVGALESVGQALEVRPFSVRGPADGETDALTVVVVEPCGPDFFMRPNPEDYRLLNFPNHLDAPDLRMVHTPLTPDSPGYLQRAGVHPDVILNNVVVAEAVTEAMRDFFGEFVAPYQEADVPVVNGLDAVTACGREENSRRFENETGFIYPRLRRIAPPTTPADAIIAEIEADFSWPVLIRDTRTNLGMGVRLFDGPDALSEALVDMRMPEYFVIQYHECRDDDGVGMQYRIAVVGDEAFVDRANAHFDFQSHDDLRDEPVWVERGFDKLEQAFFADADEALGFDWKQVFAPVFEKTPLEVYGFDFGVTREGRPIIYEINAAMNLYNPRSAGRSPYLVEPFRATNEKVVAYLKARAGKPA